MSVTEERIGQIHEVFKLLDQNSKEYKEILDMPSNLCLYKPITIRPDTETGESCLSKKDIENARLG